MICARLCNMYNSNLRSQWTCTVLWHCKVNPCGVWHQCSLVLKYKHRGVSHYPCQSVSLTAVWMGKWKSHFLCSQHNMVANSLTWWFQSLEKGHQHHFIYNFIISYESHTPSSYDVDSCHRHVIGIHIYHMNSSYIIWQFLLLLEQCLESIWVLSGVSSTCVYQIVWWWYGSLNFCCQVQTYNIAY